jgi:hypothetical protein
MELAEPWKGKQWGDGDNVFGGLKLLVLGESAFYAGAVGTSPQDMITGAVSAYLAQHRDQYGLFYPKITTLLSGKNAHWELNEHEKRAIWDSILLWNYVPFAVAEYSRVRPTAQMFIDAAPHFKQFIERHTPTGILVCGYTTWGWLMQDEPTYEGNPWETPQNPLHRIGGSVVARMPHPSGRGFSYNKGRSILDQLRRACEAIDQSTS